MERVLKWQQWHGAGLEAAGRQTRVGTSPVGRQEQHGEEDLAPQPGPSMSPHSHPSPRLALPRRSGGTSTWGSFTAQGRWPGRCFWGSDRGFLHHRSWRARQPPCWIGTMRFIRCSANTLRKARRKIIDLAAYLLPWHFSAGAVLEAHLTLLDQLGRLLLAWAVRC